MEHDLRVSSMNRRRSQGLAIRYLFGKVSSRRLRRFSAHVRVKADVDGAIPDAELKQLGEDHTGFELTWCVFHRNGEEVLDPLG